MYIRNPFLRMVIAVAIAFIPMIVSSLIRKRIMPKLNEKQKKVVKIIGIVILVLFVINLYAVVFFY